MTFIKKLFSEYLPFMFFLITILLVFTNINTCNRLKDEKEARKQDKEIYDQNFDALLDTIRVSYNKRLESFEYDKKVFLTTLNELSKYDSSLSNKLDNIKGDIISAINSKISIDSEEVEVDNELEKYDDENYGLRWDYDYNDKGLSQYISGVSKFKLYNNKIFAGSTLIDTNRMSIGITYGFRELENKYKVWAISSSPRVNINELSGAYFIDKPAPYTPTESYQNRWIIGPYFGYGVNFDNSFENSRLGWNFGLSIQYNLFGLGKKPITNNKNPFSFRKKLLNEIN